jgi:MFS family permease
MNSSPQENVGYLFKFLLFANMCLYLEAGAIPAMLLQVSESFGMSAGHQGLLGGIPYLSLGFGSPFAGYLMRNYNQKRVLSVAVGINSFFTLLWAMTPVGKWYSLILFIAARFIMGLMQCIVCVFMPLWTNEFAPSSQRTKWMGALQVYQHTHEFFTLFL